MKHQDNVKMDIFLNSNVIMDTESQYAGPYIAFFLINGNAKSFPEN